MQELTLNEIDMVAGGISPCDIMRWLRQNCNPKKPYRNPLDPYRFIPRIRY